MNCKLCFSRAHQTHYEQHGTLTGTVEIDGKSYNFTSPSMRDHSYGMKKSQFIYVKKIMSNFNLSYLYTLLGVKRNWKLLYRYIFHMFSLEDGRRFDVGNVCQPVTSSQ